MQSDRTGLFVYYRWLILLLASGLCLLPLWATVIGGFKSSGDLRTNAFGLPRQWLVENYVSIATGVRFWQMLGNSAVIAFVSVALTLLVSSMAAFVLAHLRFAGKRWIANYLALGLTFPFATAVLPVFIRVRDLGLLDSYWGVIQRVVRSGLCRRLQLPAHVLANYYSFVPPDPGYGRRPRPGRELERVLATPGDDKRPSSLPLAARDHAVPR